MTEGRDVSCNSSWDDVLCDVDSAVVAALEVVGRPRGIRLKRGRKLMSRLLLGMEWEVPERRKIPVPSPRCVCSAAHPARARTWPAPPQTSSPAPASPPPSPTRASYKSSPALHAHRTSSTPSFAQSPPSSAPPESGSDANLYLMLRVTFRRPGGRCGRWWKHASSAPCRREWRRRLTHMNADKPVTLFLFSRSRIECSRCDVARCCITIAWT